MGVEIGVGTGRFATPLGLQYGVDPSAGMRARARERGTEVADGVAEALPYPNNRFDKALVTTTLCYLDDPPEAVDEGAAYYRPADGLWWALLTVTAPWDSDTKNDAPRGLFTGMLGSIPQRRRVGSSRTRAFPGRRLARRSSWTRR